LLAVVGMTIVEMSMVLEVMVVYDEGVRVLMLSLVMNMVIMVFLGIGVKSMRDKLNVEIHCGLGWLGIC